MFVTTAALFWWGLLGGRYGRAGYGAAVFYVFTTVVHTGLLGAIMTLAPLPLYPTYVGRAVAHLAADPEHTDRLQNLGAVLHRAGRFEEAAKRLAEADGTFPGDTDV